MEKISSPILRYFADYIEKQTGIVYGEENAYQLDTRLREICKGLDVPNLDSLFAKAQSEGVNGHFKQFLLDLATNNETTFFRDPKVFKAFENHMVPERLKAKPVGAGLKVWSAASSFGQEAYSLAMILQQLIDTGSPLAGSEILATDVSTRALERVREARYSHLEVQRGLPATLMIKYFDKDAEDYWRIKPAIKQRVKTKHMNLLQVAGVDGPYDILFCRNVLIYQTEERKRAIIAALATQLASGGFFVLGAAESLIGLSNDFEQVTAEGAIFYRKK